MSTILITGGSGLLGGNLTKLAVDKFKEVYTIYNKNPIKIENSIDICADITDEVEINKLIRNLSPEFIVHCAALTNVDYCEGHHKEAYEINVKGTENLAKFAEDVGAVFIYISTDSVFDGKKGQYTENDQPNPINYYGVTKLEGEKALKKYNIDSTIIRTNIYGWNIRNNKYSLAEWVIDGLKKKVRPSLFNDVFFSPILVNNLAECIFEVCERNLKGIFNIAGSERCSKLDFGLKLADVFNLDKSYILPMSIDNYIGLNAPRPKDMSLDVTKAKKTLNTKLLNVEEGIIWMKRLIDDGYADKLNSYNRYHPAID
ncbi:MAG: dTDP-4-dehydrorhamnose reductase [Candidatus Altiarchaeales archaeon HGW-Altiarchaeales-2]|nr:MAG: dTDP-4-dehydrorhamnose reductase [Candidatus Altiarchaeales archaeon HGW-Altiarchaeales-2]